DPQSGPRQGPRILRLPQEAGGVPPHPRRQQDHAAALEHQRIVRHLPQAAEGRGDERQEHRRDREERNHDAHEQRTCQRRREEAMKRRVLLFAGGLLLLLAYLATGLTEVRPGERAVIRRFGRVLEETPGPGLWIGLPWGMDRVDRVSVDSVRRVVVGYRE